MCVCVCVFVPQGFYKGGKFVFSFKVRDTFTHLKNQFSITKDPLLSWFMNAVTVLIVL